MAWGVVAGVVGSAVGAFGRKKAKDIAKKITKKAIGRAVIGGITGAAVAPPVIRSISSAVGGGPDRAFVDPDRFGGIGGPGGFKAFGKVFGGGTSRITPGEMGACPKGYHLNKGKLSDGLEAGSVCVRNRRTNFANGRAAKRAGTRLRGTVKMLRRSFSLVSAKPPKGKFIPKGRK